MKKQFLFLSINMYMIAVGYVQPFISGVSGIISNSFWMRLYIKRVIALIIGLISYTMINAQTDICMRPGVIFCNGFEGTASDVNTAWGSPYPGALIQSDVGPFNVSGNQVVRLKHGEDSFHYQFPAGCDKAYARWYQKWESGYTWGNNHGSGLGANQYFNSGVCPGKDVTAQAWLDESGNGSGMNLYAYYNGMTDYKYCFGDLFGAHSFPLKTNQWYCIETMIDMGTPTAGRDGANGVIDFWIDGVEFGPFGGLWLRQNANFKVNNVFFELFRHDGYKAKSVFIDDVVVSTQRIGPAAGRCGGNIGTNYWITASAGEGGSISPDGSVIVSQGANKNFTITPYSGYQISQVTVDGVDQGAITSYTFTNVQAAYTISASFAIGADTLILDNTSAGTSQDGTWAMGYAAGYYGGGSYHWSLNKTGHWYKWTGKLTPGTYSVSAWWQAKSGRPTNVSYDITHSSGTATVSNINQSVNGSRWNLLGTYTFASACTVKVNSATTGTEGTCADAIRFVKVGGTNNTVTASASTEDLKLFVNYIGLQISYNYDFGRNEKASVNIYDVRGRLIKQVDTNTELLRSGITCDIEQWPAGLYAVRLITKKVNLSRSVIIKK